MKVALCLAGLTGGTSESKNGQGDPIDPKIIFNNFKNHVLDKNNIDVFIHSWSVENKKILNELYKPKLSIFEPQINFHSDFRQSITRSRWYSAKKSIELKTLYETQHSIKYDMVMLCRLDLMWLSDIIFENYNPFNFYATHWNGDGNNKLGPFDKRNLNTGSGFYDTWFFSNSNYMNGLANLYDNIDNLLKIGIPLSNHSLSYAHIKTLNYPISYTMYRGYDCEVYRRYKNPNWKLQ